MHHAVGHGGQGSALQLQRYCGREFLQSVEKAVVVLVGFQAFKVA